MYYCQTLFSSVLVFSLKLNFRVFLVSHLLALTALFIETSKQPQNSLTLRDIYSASVIVLDNCMGNRISEYVLYFVTSMQKMLLH